MDSAGPGPGASNGDSSTTLVKWRRNWRMAGCFGSIYQPPDYPPLQEQLTRIIVRLGSVVARVVGQFSSDCCSATVGKVDSRCNACRGPRIARHRLKTINSVAKVESFFLPRYADELQTCEVCEPEFSPATTASVRRFREDRSKLRDLLGQERFEQLAQRGLLRKIQQRLLHSGRTALPGIVAGRNRQTQTRAVATSGCRGLA